MILCLVEGMSHVSAPKNIPIHKEEPTSHGHSKENRCEDSVSIPNIPVTITCLNKEIESFSVKIKLTFFNSEKRKTFFSSPV